MNIGLMRNNLKPSHLSEMIAIYSKAFNVNVLYMRPKDIDIEKKKVRAKMLMKGKWIKIYTDIPEFIDISRYCFKKNKKVTDFLRNHTRLSDNGLIKFNKIKFIEELAKDKRFKEILIPTQEVNKVENIKQFIKDYNRLILKPKSGQFGQGIFYLEAEANNYILKYDDKTQILTQNEFLNFYNKKIHNNRYIAQKYIESRSKQGHPFDCRINMEKNLQGEWTIAKHFIRIGIGQSVVSNISQGGAVGGVKPFLNANFTEETSRKIRRKLKQVAHTLPYKIEELREQQLMTLGIDIGIDVDGEVYLFEVNSAPGTSQLRAEAALLRAEYYSYMKKLIEQEVQ